MSTTERFPPPGTFAPATGERLDAVVGSTPEQVREAVESARRAQPAWASLTLRERRERLDALARHVLQRADAICAIISRETGKSETEALMNEVALVGTYAKSAGQVARRALRPDKIRLSPLDYPGKKARVDPVPRGVVGIIAPWNYPFSNFFKPLFPALLSGNTVVLKPSEYTPRSGQWFAERCAEVLPAGVVEIVQGGGEVGAMLLESGIDAVVFTGSVSTGRKVAARAGELLIPCSVELGGKDAAIVLADCDLDRTVAGVAQWSMHNCGQNCAAIERVYVEDAIADAFVERLGEVLAQLRVAPEEPSELGPLQSHMQRDVVERHVADALEKGARLVTGGVRVGPGLGYRPTLLDRCTDEMLVVREETFGPVVAVVRVGDAAEAIAQANASPYGLNGSVWTRDVRRGRELARKLEVGVALVNNHAITGTLASTPWSGVKDTGHGVAASRHAYHTFVRPRTLFVDTSTHPDPWWFPANDDLRALGDALVERSLGSLAALVRLAGLVKRRIKAVKKFAAGGQRT